MPRQLPARPSLENLQKQAKSLLQAYRTTVPDAIVRIRDHHPRWQNLPSHARFTLADAQLVVAREYGFTTWAVLKAHVLSLQPDAVTEASIRSLQDAAGRGDLARLAALLDANPGLIDETAGPGVRTALHHAVFGKSEAGVRFLLERGANPNIRCEGDNAYPLHFAVEKQLFPIVRLLVEHDADPIGEGDYHELGVLGWATAWESISPSQELVDYLLAHGARHTIFSAVAVGDLAAIRASAAHTPADLERRMDVANRRRLPLHLAVIKHQPQALLTLLDLGANPESLDVSNFTPLDQAAFFGYTDMAQMLLNRGAKIRLPAAIALGRTVDVERLLARDPGALKPGNRWGHLIVRAAERASGSVIDALSRPARPLIFRTTPSLLST
jgi:ankyrin repeat protein